MATPQPGTRAWRMGIRLAGQLVADGGRTSVASAQDLAKRTEYTQVMKRSDGSNKGLASTRAVTYAVRWLADEGVARQGGGHIVTDDMSDLAAWLADELEEHPWDRTA